jgi:hypothetical protein
MRPSAAWFKVQAIMGRTRNFFEKLLFPGSYGQRRRHMRFFLLALLLGLIVALTIGAMFVVVNMRGHAF